MADLYTVRYYQEKLGRWRGAYRFTITGWSPFCAARLGWFGRANLVGLWVAQRLLGPLTMETRLAAEFGPIADALQLVHFTWITKWGMTLYRSREVFTLDPNGSDVTIVRVQAYGPLFRPDPPDAATAVAQPEQAGMVYDWSWFDRRLRQETRALGPDSLALLQTSDYCRGEVTLVRFTA